MTGELLSYGATLVGVLFGFIFVPVATVLVLVRLAGALAARRAHPAASSRPQEPARDGAAEEWRRCNHCKRRWWGVEGSDLPKREVQRRRRARQAARAEGTTAEWARPQGWTRCPTCLSKDVRTSVGRRVP